MEKETIDSYEIFENYFEELKKICFPATVKNAFGLYEVNPTTGLCIEFILKTIESFDSNLDKQNFVLLWMKFTGILHSYFMNMYVDHLFEAKWVKEEHRTQKILGKDVKFLLRKPEGFEIFYQKEFKLFLEKIEKIKKDWDQDLLDKKNIQKTELIDSGSTMGSGEYAGYIEF